MQEEKRKKRICFIINPRSGTRKSQDITNLIRSVFNAEEFDISIRHTEYARHAKLLSKEAVKSKTDIIVAVGGDGTVNEVASEMINSTVVLGIVPRGSGNGLARHLGIPHTISGALNVIHEGYQVMIDSATVNGKPFVSIAGIGFDALVAKEFAKNKQRGFLTYFGIVTNRFLAYKQKKYKLLIDDSMQINVSAFFICFANSNQFGYNTIIAPNAKLNDGKLDVCIVNKPKVFNLPKIANLLLLKRIDRSENVQTFQTGNLTVKRNRNKIVNIDGEPVKMKKTLDIRIVPLSLNIIIPKNAEKE